jgi:hypothetical protein
MNGTEDQAITAGLTGHTPHARELREAINDLLDGLAVLQGLAETPQPPAGALGWLAVKLGGDALRIQDAAARIGRATCQVVAA